MKVHCELPYDLGFVPHELPFNAMIVLHHLSTSGRVQVVFDDGPDASRIKDLLTQMEQEGQIVLSRLDDHVWYAVDVENCPSCNW